jgi:large subunit ribosomal protein L9
VTSTEVADRLNEMLGLELDRRRIGDKPLRELGVFSVPIRLDAGVLAHVRVIVHREDEDPEESAAIFSAHEAEEEARMEYEAEMEEEASVESEDMDEDSSPEAETNVE